MSLIIKVARFIPFFSGQYGGTANHIFELTKHLNKYLVKTIVYSASEIDYHSTKRTEVYQKINPNFIVKRFNSYLRFKDYRISFGLIRTLLKDSKNVDIFHFHPPKSFQEDIAALIAIKNKKKLVITSHGALNLSISYFQHLYERIKDFIIGYVENKLFFLY